MIYLGVRRPDSIRVFHERNIFLSPFSVELDLRFGNIVQIIKDLEGLGVLGTLLPMKICLEKDQTKLINAVVLEFLDTG